MASLRSLTRSQWRGLGQDPVEGRLRSTCQQLERLCDVTPKVAQNVPGNSRNSNHSGSHRIRLSFDSLWLPQQPPQLPPVPFGDTLTPRFPARNGPAADTKGFGEGRPGEAQARSLLSQPILLLFGAELGKDRNFQAQLHFPKSLKTLQRFALCFSDSMSPSERKAINAHGLGLWSTPLAGGATGATDVWRDVAARIPSVNSETSP